MEFIVGIWWNGNKKNPKFEFRVSKTNRDNFFPKQGESNFTHILLPEQNNFHKVNLRPSFWNQCSHFGSDIISAWLYSNNHVPYPKGCPPKFRMKAHPDNRFQILGLAD